MARPGARAHQRAAGGGGIAGAQPRFGACEQVPAIGKRIERALEVGAGGSVLVPLGGVVRQEHEQAAALLGRQRARCRCFGPEPGGS